MRYIIASFRSRNQTMVFYEILLSYGIKCKIINTPRMATVSCGLSVRFETIDFDRVKAVITRRNFAGFAGFFAVYEMGNNKIVTSI